MEHVTIRCHSHHDAAPPAAPLLFELSYCCCFHIRRLFPVGVTLSRGILSSRDQSRKLILLLHCCLELRPLPTAPHQHCAPVHFSHRRLSPPTRAFCDASRPIASHIRSCFKDFFLTKTKSGKCSPSQLTRELHIININLY